NIVDDTPLARLPDDLHRHFVGETACSEDAHGGIPSEVPTATTHLLALHGHGAPKHSHTSTDTARVRSGAAERHGDSGRATIVAVDEGGGIEAVDDDVQISVIVQV